MGKSGVRPITRPTTSDIAHAIGMGLACVLSYWIMTRLLGHLVGRDDDLLGGMWAAIAAAFVFRDTRSAALTASLGRLTATAASCVLCLALLSFTPPSALGMSMILTAGTVLLIAINLRDDIVTMAITTIVIMVVALISPADGKIQPVLRFIDTVVGIAVGLACHRAASLCVGVKSALTCPSDAP